MTWFKSSEKRVTNELVSPRYLELFCKIPRYLDKCIVTLMEHNKLKMKFATLLVFVVVLTTAYGWYMRPNLVSGNGDHTEVYKSLAEFFSKLSSDATQVAAISDPGRR
ncbi:hypothetical protein Zmor_011447 [Zophobas morio]|uniref:Uncharacterized protein n=1 Tax=Zophobas morio TaxID=2755281 RepID=A0AA38IV56_9CUCU|nr:hypothetical protein Zmor_011447 [Zophobas morio]